LLIALRCVEAFTLKSEVSAAMQVKMKTTETAKHAEDAQAKDLTGQKAWP
jgi:hypothetical protein